MVIDRGLLSGTVAANQKGAAPLAVFAAPATGDEVNTLGERLVPKGCFKIEDLLFDFDSSFVRPDIEQGLPRLAQLRVDHKIKDPKSGADLFPPLSIFGHADPVGNDDRNKQLSGRRAAAIYGMLVRDVDLWDRLFTAPLGPHDWGTRSIQVMLSRVQSPIGTDGQSGAETRDAVRTFQAAQGLGVDGTAGPLTRKALYRAYMDALCGPRLLLDKVTDFLGRNADAGGKADFQGCSEFNPLLLFSKSEAGAFAGAADKTDRNRENAPNRRVMVLLFAPGRRVRPAAWPCPRASDGVAACKKRFFPDGDTRRSFQAQRRAFEDTKDTFACRFYQLVSDDSPCERVKPAPPPPPPPPPPEVSPLIIFPGATPAAARSAIGAPISGRNFVVMKKPYTRPARVPVTLKSDRPFDGSGQFTVDGGRIQFFAAIDGLLALQFNGTDNVFTGAQLTAGVTVFAEGLSVSGAVDDVTLTLTISATLATIPAVTRAQMTSVELFLDIAGPRPTPTTEPPLLPQPTTATAPPGTPTDKLFGGRVLQVQDAGNNQARALLIARIVPSAFATTLEVRANVGTNPVSLFDNEDPKAAGAALALPQSITPVPADGRRFFVQGTTASAAVRDVELLLGIAGVEPNGDRVAITVVQLELTSPLIDIPRKVTHGAAVVVNDDFDNETFAGAPPPPGKRELQPIFDNEHLAATPKEDDLLKVTIRFAGPAALATNLQLRAVEGAPGAARVRLWPAATKGAAATVIALPADLPLNSLPRDVFVEGLQNGRVTLEASVGPTTAAASDRMAVNVVEVVDTQGGTRRIIYRNNTNIRFQVLGAPNNYAFEWDLDGDGNFNTAAFETPRTTADIAIRYGPAGDANTVAIPETAANTRRIIDVAVRLTGGLVVRPRGSTDFGTGAQRGIRVALGTFQGQALPAQSTAGLHTLFTFSEVAPVRFDALVPPDPTHSGANRISFNATVTANAVTSFLAGLGAARRVLFIEVGPSIFTTGQMREDLTGTVNHEIRHLQQHVAVRDNVPANNVWRLLDTFFGAVAGYSDFREAEGHWSELIDANVSWFHQISAAQNDLQAFTTRYNRCLTALGLMPAGATRTAARQLLQDLYRRLPFFEMKRPGYDFSVLPPP